LCSSGYERRERKRGRVRRSIEKEKMCVFGGFVNDGHARRRTTTMPP
jgi:hypothetical protein